MTTETDAMIATTNRVVVVGMLDTMLVRERSDKRERRGAMVETTRRSGRTRGTGGRWENLRLQVGSPYGGMFAPPYPLRDVKAPAGMSATPLAPLGLNLYISSFRFERPVVSLYKIVLPFVGLLTLCLGIVTYVLKGFGVDWNWILRGDQAMLLVVIASVWKQISYNFLFFLAGLQSIPRSLIEAASIDGASPTRRFWTIVFPLLSPTTFFLLVVNIVYAFFDTFGVIDATTQGGPAQATQILVYKVYHDGVKASDLGGSSAQSVILMIIVIALTVVQFRYVERKVNY